MSKFYGAFHLLPMSSGNENGFIHFPFRLYVVAFILGSLPTFFYLVLVESVVDETSMAAK